MGVKTYSDYYELIADKEIAKKLPPNPEQVYKEWLSWNFFLDSFAYSYKDAQKIVQSLGIKSAKTYRRMAREGTLPDGLPPDPEVYYSLGKRNKTSN